MTTRFPEQREKLILRKSELDLSIAKLKAQIDEAKQRAYNEKRFLAPYILRNWRVQLAEWQQESQRLQVELGRVSTQIKSEKHKSLAENFVDIARIRLPLETFNNIMQSAARIDEWRGDS